MHDIYMVSYFGGMFGEFICTQISLDKNFYHINPKKDLNNRYHYSSPLTDTFSNLKSFPIPNDLFSVTEIKEIEQTLLQKNICFPSHYYDQNIKQLDLLPNIKCIRLFTRHRDVLILGYCCQWIKSLLVSYDLHSYNNKFVKEFESYSFTPETRDLYELIKIKKRFYWFEKLALKYEQNDLSQFITFWWKFYRESNKKKIQGWQRIDVGGCLKNYNTVKDEWTSCFNLNDNLNKIELDNYHQRNIDLIEKEFGTSFDNFIKEDWKMILLEWINLKTDTILTIS